MTSRANPHQMTSTKARTEKLRVCEKVIEQLCEDWPELAEDDARKLRVHDLILRLPRQYGIDAHHLEDIETHVRLLEEAKMSEAPVVHVREVLVGANDDLDNSDDVGDNNDNDDGIDDINDDDDVVVDEEDKEDASMGGSSSNRQRRFSGGGINIERNNSGNHNNILHRWSSTSSNGLNQRGLRKPIFGSSLTLSSFQANGEPTSPPSRGGSMQDGGLVRKNSIGTTEGTYEIAVAGGNKPRTLSRISTTLFDAGLNIAEAHVFCTSDGFVLDVFVAQGWRENDAKGLEASLTTMFQQMNWGNDMSPPPKPPSSSKNLVDSAPAHPQQKTQTTQNDSQNNKKSSSSNNNNSRRSNDTRGTPSPVPSEWEIDEKLLTYSEKIAQGAFGVLYLGQYCGQAVAVKVLKTSKNENHEDVKREFQQELSTLRKVHHKNVIQLIGAITKGPLLCLVTEFMHGGSMLSFLHKNAPLKLSQIVKYSIGVALGLDYLHKINIVHRDVKTANLLMDENDVVKIADFGVARVMSKDGAMTAETGTYRWMAPEVIAHQLYNHKCDVYSFAITLWELVTGGDMPYSGYTPLQAAVGVVQRGMRPTIPQSCHPVLAHTIQYSWQADMNTRSEFEQIVEMLRDVNVTGDGKNNENGGLMSRFRSMGFINSGSKKKKEKN